MPITPQQLREELTRIGRYTPEEIDDFVRRAEQGHTETERERTRDRILGLSGPPDRSPVDPGGGGSHDTAMDEGWRSSVDTRLGELRGAMDGLRHSFTILAGAVGLVATIMAFGFGFLGLQLNRLDGKIDAIPQRLSEEFRAMRAEMAAQTSAIANSITATRQAQPPAPPQIIVIPPTPQQQPTPEPPKP
jgi:hypothetical protein